MIYLDNAASMPLFNSVIENLEKTNREDFFNPSSAHRKGKELSKKIELIREDFLSYLNSSVKYNFIFTSSATEANNIISNERLVNKAETVLFTKSDHASIVNTVKNLESLNVNCLEYSILEDGNIDLDQLIELVEKNENCKLVLLTHLNGQSGKIQDIYKIVKKIKSISNEIHIHIDAAQSFGKNSINLEDGLIDSLSISAHKMGGPKGVGGLYFKKGIALDPIMFGGGHEFNLRPGTLPWPLISSFGVALEECRSQSYEKKYELVNYMKKKILRDMKEVIFPFSEERSHIVSFIAPNISSDIILRHLESEDIYISSTSACSSKIKGNNSIFSALKIKDNFHKNVLRVSVGHQTTVEDIDKFINRFSMVYRELIALVGNK